VLYHVSELAIEDIAQFLKLDVKETKARLTRAERHASRVLKADPDLAKLLGIEVSELPRHRRS
jgi:DNA-directed RNA polymerase specialized sigma24 family protein